jgi:monovalent cation:H+ antiporter-2, CPA2 family
MTDISLNAAQQHMCSHVQGLTSVQPESPDTCPECVALGDTWVHLRVCMSCGHVGCCDSSKNQHATRHFQSSRHPVMKSLQPGEDWAYCYVDELMG